VAEHDTDLAEVLAEFTNYIMNERVRSYNEGIDVERERLALMFEQSVNHVWDKDEVADAIRSAVGRQQPQDTGEST
jgi:hypothetical protein